MFGSRSRVDVIGAVDPTIRDADGRGTGWSIAPVALSSWVGRV